MFNKKIKTPFLIILLLLSGIVHAQSGLWKNASFGVQGHYGSFITSLTRSVYVKDSYTSLMELSYIRQTDGSKSWHKANGLPQWGLGLFFWKQWQPAAHGTDRWTVQLC